MKDNMHLFFIEFTFSVLNEKGLNKDLIEHLKRQAESKSGITLEEIIKKTIEGQEKRVKFEGNNQI